MCGTAAQSAYAEAGSARRLDGRLVLVVDVAQARTALKQEVGNVHVAVLRGRQQSTAHRIWGTSHARCSSVFKLGSRSRSSVRSFCTASQGDGQRCCKPAGRCAERQYFRTPRLDEQSSGTDR